MSVFRDLLHVDEPTGSRFDLALDLFASGRRFVFRGFVLSLEEGRLVVFVPYAGFVDHVTTERAREDFGVAASTFRTLVEDSGRFRSLVADSLPRFLLVWDTGMGISPMCELDGDVLRWERGFEPPGA